MTRIKMFKKLSAAACTLLLAGSITACGGGGDNASSCADGQIKATIGADGAEQCYTKCTADTECGTGEECKSYGSHQLCVEKKSTNNPNNMKNNPNNMTCNITCQTTMAKCEGNKAITYSEATKNDADCMCEGNEPMEVNCEDDGKICSNGACVADPNDFAEECKTLADIQFGTCVENICMGLSADQKMQNATNKNNFIMGGVNAMGQMVAPCHETAKTNTQLRDILLQVRNGMLTCDPARLKAPFCQEYGNDACGCKPPTVGTACTMNEECDGGDLNGVCIPETDMNGMMTGPPGGQCVAGPCNVGGTPMAGQIAVGAGTGCGENACQVVNTGQGLAQICVPTCEQNSDCDRAVDATGQNGSYACNVIGLFRNTQTMQVAGVAGMCEAACSTANEAMDCPTLMGQGGQMFPQVCGSTFTCAVTCDTDADCGMTSGPDHKCVDKTADGITAKYCEVVVP